MSPVACARLFAAVVALAAIAAPLDSAAATRHRARSHHAVASYPMKADEFRALMEKRIDGIRGVIDRKLDRRGVSAERKKAIHKIFDESSRDLRAEIDKAAADGTVTQSEADKVKTLASGLRGKVRERLRAEKDPHAKAKLDKEEAAKKEKAVREAKEAKEAKKTAGHTKTEGGEPEAVHDGAPNKVAKHEQPKPKSGKTKGKGPTKPAKDSPGKKHRPAQTEDPGANL